MHRALAGGSTDLPEAKELIERFAASELGRRAAHATRLEREFDFLLAVEDVVLRGQIDLWFEESGELVLVDYKTDRDESSEASPDTPCNSGCMRWRSKPMRGGCRIGPRCAICARAEFGK